MVNTTILEREGADTSHKSTHICTYMHTYTQHALQITYACWGKGRQDICSAFSYKNAIIIQVLLGISNYMIHLVGVGKVWNDIQKNLDISAWELTEGKET